MNRILILAGIFTVFAALAPSQLGKFVETRPAAKQEEVREVSAASRESEEPRPGSAAGRSVRIAPGRGGHFMAEARMNGRAIEVLVDTGATLVAINESTARRLGIRLTPADFKYRVRTANGFAEAAAATIEEIRIGRVSVQNVPASVSRDSALSTTLLGMSFLSKLKKFSVEGGELVLVQ